MTQATEQLARLIQKKHQALVQLREVGLRQAELVASGDTSALLKLLGVKQQLIVAVQQIERELSPRYDENPEERDWPSAGDRARCAQQAAECNALLREIVSLERSSADKMAVRRDEVAQQLHQVHVAAHVRSAYEAQCRTG
jgi:hypothetical protein